MKNIGIIHVDKRQELFGLVNIPAGQIVYVQHDNVFYCLIDWSNRHKFGGWKAVGISIVSAGVSPTVHNLVDTVNHPVSGLTTGHFLKATGASTYAFAVHGLTYSDVNAISKNSPSVDREILIWDGTGGSQVRVSTGTTISSGGDLQCSGDVIAYYS